MKVIYEVTDPNRLSEVKTPSQIEIKAYLDLCLELGNDFTNEQCLLYWQRGDCTNDEFEYDPFVIGGTCVKALKAYLDAAEIELSEKDQQLLNFASMDDDCQKITGECVPETIRANIEKFSTIFENQYLKEALKIYTVCNILNAIHSYNSSLEQYCDDMLFAHDLVCTLPRYQQYSLHAFDTTGYSARRVKPNRHISYYSMMYTRLCRIKMIHRHKMKQSLARDNAWDPLCRQKLRVLLSELYDDNASTVDIHPVVAPQLAHKVQRAIKLNHELYQQLNRVDKLNYVNLSPHRTDYRFLESMQMGARIWHGTKFYQKHHKHIRRALELFDLVERVVVYQYALPNGFSANARIFGLPSICNDTTWSNRLIGPSLAHVEKEDILKQLWSDGLRVEIDSGEIILHPVKESSTESPWYIKRIREGFEGMGHSEFYDKYKDSATPWRVNAGWA